MVPRRSSGRQQPAPDGDEPVADLNEIVAYNFRRARELRGWTQQETAERLERFVGVRLRQAGVSAIEAAYGGERRREFDAQEILAFACGFDLPLVWFFLPPPGDRRRFRGAPEQVNELYRLTLGREDQLPALYDRFRELGTVEPDEDDTVLQRLYGAPTERQLADYRRRRKDLLLALLDDQADELDRSAEELGRFFDHLRQVGIRGYVAEHAGDSDYLRRAQEPAEKPVARRRRKP